jgi:hypothetical protein
LEKERERNIKRDLELKRVLSEIKIIDNNNMVKPTEDKPKKKKNLTLVKKTTISNKDDNTKALKELEKLLLNNYKILNQKSRPTADTHYESFRTQIYQSYRDDELDKNLEVFKKLINNMITKLKSKEDKPKEDKPKPKKKLKQTMEIKFKKKKEEALKTVPTNIGRASISVKKLVPKTFDDEDKLDDLRQDVYRQKTAKEELEEQKKIHKMIENFFNNDGGVYKRSLDIYSGDALKDYLDKMERGGIFKIDPELKKKIYKKLKIK